MRYKNLIFTGLMILPYGDSSTLNAQEKKKNSTLEYSAIKEAIKNDGLEKTIDLKQTIHQEVMKDIEVENKSKFLYPPKGDLLKFLSEYWLVKENLKLSWDFQKPDYGLDKNFAEFLEKIGIYHHEFKILIINSPLVAHFSLPLGPKEGLYLISLPFMRTLDLSKLEISLLLFENYIRLKLKQLEKKLIVPQDKDGISFEGKKIEIDYVYKLMEDISSIVFEKGFSFQDQFETTMAVSEILKAYPEIYKVYVDLIKKIHESIKIHSELNSYLKLYPSPIMQLKWLKVEHYDSN